MAGTRAADRSSSASAVMPLATALADPRDWAELVTAALVPNPFHGPAMVGAAAGRIEPRSWQVVKVAGAAGRLDALAVVRPTRIVPVAGPPVLDGFWSHYGPRGTPLLGAGVEDAAARLLDALATLGPVVRLRYLALDDPVTRALVAAAEARGAEAIVPDRHERACLVADASPVDARGPALAGRRLRDLDRQMRRLAETGAVVHRTATAPAEVQEAVEAFVRLEATGWKGRGGSAFASRPARTDFVRAFASALAPDNRMRADVLAVAGEPVAALLTLREGDTGYLWKIAYDERFAAASPGLQLARLATEAFLADPGLQMVDSLATAGHPLVDRLWRGRLAMGTLVLATHPEANAAAARVAAAYRLAERLRDRLRRIKRRLTGSRPQPPPPPARESRGG